ncbi:MAG: hypothetical protein DWQ04_24015 [Chloroflexi bacterium]|nr:MAG: hypothetical protein DWQ04_24015 [Chloroflexota bacterium]
MVDLINGRYHLHTLLGEGGMGKVFRATDRLTGNTVALKQVTTPEMLHISMNMTSNATDSAMRLALAHEFQTLAGLRHPYIISVLDYGFDVEKRPYFTMDYLTPAQNLREAGQGLSIEAKIDLIQQVLQALAYLHRRDILHRDLKPENVLVQDGHVRVLDFGLAATGGKGGRSVGTYLYMAPELYDDAPFSAAADLYAVGVIAFQLLAGNHPFAPVDHEFILRVIDNKPDFSWLTDYSGLAAVIGRLLAKDPRDRYKSASEALADFAAAVGQALPPETTAIRESYLQAAKFVGREAEMVQLKDAMLRAEMSFGSAWLIGGESGVGKTRFINELRTKALVDGFVVLRGQGIQDGGRLPYQLWSAPLRHLLLALPDVPDLIASVLLPLVPDIPDLLGRDIPLAPPLADEPAQIRLFSAIAQLFELVKRPLLLILEDLHWAEASLAPIPYLLHQINQQPLLLIGTYRDDERPELTRTLSEMQTLHLNRLTADDMVELSTGMLGEIGQRPDILQLLQRETEGNAFFVVEVVRALAEDIGRLSQIGQMSLPETLLPDGIQSIVERRLDTVLGADQKLLQLAAVAGRTLDLDVMQQLNDNILPDRWLSTCMDAYVLEIEDDIWQFRHAKIRDGLLATISAEKLQAHHQRVAQAIEQVYPNDPQHAAQLMYHWRQAKNQEKVRTFAYQAGIYAASQYANEDALICLTITFELTDAAELEQRYDALLTREKTFALMGRSEAQKADLEMLADLAQKIGQPEQQAEVALRQANYAITISDFPAAIAYTQTAVSQAHLANNKLLLTRAHRHHGRTLAAQGNYEAAVGAFEHALILAQQIENGREIARLLAQLGGIADRRGQFEQAADYFKQSLVIHQELENVQGEATALWSLGQTAVNLTSFQEAHTYLEQSLEIFQTIGDKQGESKTRNSLAILYSDMGKPSEEKKHLEQALEIEQSIGSKAGIGKMLNNLGTHAYGQKQYDEAYGYFEQQIKIAEETGDKLGQTIGFMNIGSTFLDRKGAYHQAMRHLERSLSLAQELESKDLEAGILMHLGGLFNRLGQYNVAKPYLEKALTIHQQIGRRWWEGWTLVYLGNWFVAQQQYKQSKKLLEATLALNKELNYQERVGTVLNILAWVAYQLGDYKQMLAHYEAALASLRDTTELHETAVSQAGITLSRFLIDGTFSEEFLMLTLAYLENNPTLMESETPFRAYLICYRLLQASNDERAAPLLTIAYHRLQAFAENIEDAAWRQSFLESVPEQWEIGRLFKSL